MLPGAAIPIIIYNIAIQLLETVYKSDAISNTFPFESN